MSVHKLTLNIDEKAFSALRQNPEGFARELLEAALSKWYELGKISQSKGAEIANIPRQEFMEVLTRNRVSPFQVTVNEIEKEIDLL